MASSPNIGDRSVARERIKYPNTRPSVDAMSTVAGWRRHVHRKTPFNGALNGKAILTYEATGGTNFRSGSCVTSVAMSTGDAQLYER
jgi:hypothetical protein